MKFEKARTPERQSELENVLLPIRNKETGRVDLQNSLSMVITSPDIMVVKSNILVTPNQKEILAVFPSKWARIQGLLIGIDVIKVKQEEVLQIEVINMSGRVHRIPKNTVLAHIDDLASKTEKKKKTEEGPDEE